MNTIYYLVIFAIVFVFAFNILQRMMTNVKLRDYSVVIPALATAIILEVITKLFSNWVFSAVISGILVAAVWVLLPAKSSAKKG
ncbi:MAG: hypothetical protein WCC10_09960 [Tumebacillaceae bacterium]